MRMCYLRNVKHGGLGNVTKESSDANKINICIKVLEDGNQVEQYTYKCKFLCVNKIVKTIINSMCCCQSSI